MIGQSSGMRKVLATVAKLTDSMATVLITGESGTGKELLARAIHGSSPHRDGEFVAVHCAALPDALFENELFGHESGAFTGAGRIKRGTVERAHGGTLFLDEVAEISPAAQVKLARFLERRQFQRLGAAESRQVNLRIITATNRRLAEDVDQGRFRADLFWRLHVVPIHLPPLRERCEDVVPLVKHFLRQRSPAGAEVLPTLSVDASIALLRYPWPGNVRELQNVVERMLVTTSRPSTFDLVDLPREIRLYGAGLADGDPQDLPLTEAIDDFERGYLIRMLRRTRGNVTDAARRLAISRSQLHRKLLKLRLQPARFRR